MSIISWDIGIKNLAYCIVDSNDKSILNWDVLNICNDNIKCYGFINNLNESCNCDKIPKFKFNLNNQEFYFCTLHKNQYEKISNNKVNEQYK